MHVSSTRFELNVVFNFVLFVAQGVMSNNKDIIVSTVKGQELELAPSLSRPGRQK